MKMTASFKKILSDSDYLVHAMEVTALLRIIDESYMIIDKKEHSFR